MTHEVDCVILWHTLDLKGTIVNSSSTHLRGSMDNLNDRLREASDKATQDQLAGKLVYRVAVQIIANRI